jgi:activator of HSP90 ATPase
MPTEFVVDEWFPVAPQVLYDAWLDTKIHTAMTGAQAHITPVVGAGFDAWDGYITGRIVELTPGERIVQLWRTGEFAEADEDSLLVLTLAREGEGTRLTLQHRQLPEGHAGEQYRQGWIDWYFAPMSSYFAARAA